MTAQGRIEDLMMEAAFAEEARRRATGQKLKTIVYLARRVEPVLQMTETGPIIVDDTVSCHIPIAVLDIPPWDHHNQTIEVEGRRYYVINVGLNWAWGGWLIQELDVAPAFSQDIRDLRGIRYSSHVVLPHVWPIEGVPEDIEDKAEPPA